MRIHNNKDAIEFIEDISFQGDNYSKIIGNRVLLHVNAVNRNEHVPDRYRNRKLPLIVKEALKIWMRLKLRFQRTT